MAVSPEEGLRAWVAYLRDMGVSDLYQREPGTVPLPTASLERLQAALASPGATTASVVHVGAAKPTQPNVPMRDVARPPGTPVARTVAPRERAGINPVGSKPDAVLSSQPFTMEQGTQELPPELAAPMPKPNPLESLFAQPDAPVPVGERPAALAALQAQIGDCTRCPLAYAGRHTIVFADGEPNAELMFVGEGPGADEDASGVPFVGKAGQLLNNMIGAMGLKREQVYIANIVKCRPPKNRVPEPVEANTCSPFLLEQIDIVQPKVIVALGATAATYLLGVKQSLAGLRGHWHDVRGAKAAVTYHPAFLLRDPRQKGEAWKDLQRVMVELNLKPPARG